MSYTVYILTNKTRTTLYIGITNDIATRVGQHRDQRDPDTFTARFNTNRLVYFESYESINDAIAREKQLKGWRRAKKQALIETTNPDWNDLATTDLGMPAVQTQPFHPIRKISRKTRGPSASSG